MGVRPQAWHQRRWDDGRTLLRTPLGDAQAIEDGATLTACLTDEHADNVPTALQRYEHVRLPRTARVQAMSETNKMPFHLPDGPDQEIRDAQMAPRAPTTISRAHARARED